MSDEKLIWEAYTKPVLTEETEQNGHELAAAIPGLKYDGIFMSTYQQFTDLAENSPCYGASFYIPIGAGLDELQIAHKRKQEEFAAGKKKRAELGI